jgi:hypothetical protein
MTSQPADAPLLQLIHTWMASLAFRAGTADEASSGTGGFATLRPRSRRHAELRARPCRQSAAPVFWGMPCGPGTSGDSGVVACCMYAGLFSRKPHHLVKTRLAKMICCVESAVSSVGRELLRDSLARYWCEDLGWAGPALDRRGGFGGRYAPSPSCRPSSGSWR